LLIWAGLLPPMNLLVPLWASQGMGILAIILAGLALGLLVRGH